MAKTWGGWTEKLWWEEFEWTMGNNKYTWGSKGAWCYGQKRNLQLHEEWETFPKELKWRIDFFARVYESETFPARGVELKMAINILEERKRAIDKQITLLKEASNG
jgi:hypothetical protein